MRAIAINAYVRYKRFTIPKRDGGQRLVSQPAREVKALQRALVSVLEHRLPIHPAATAYRLGLSLTANAAPHARNMGPIKKFDFADFFRSITVSDWYTFCRDREIFSETEDILWSANLLFHKIPSIPVLRLAVGAPSSPFISNAIMYDFDLRVTKASSKDHVTYTRYADDLTFSAPRTGFLVNVESILSKAIAEIEYPSLKVNPEKTVRATKKYRRVVTGLTLTNDGKVSIGHKKKRLIRSAVYHAIKGDSTQDELNYLAGILAFANDVEPDFLSRLSAKYGHEIIDVLMRGKTSFVRD